MSIHAPLLAVVVGIRSGNVTLRGKYCPLDKGAIKLLCQNCLAKRLVCFKSYHSEQQCKFAMNSVTELASHTCECSVVT